MWKSKIGNLFLTLSPGHLAKKINFKPDNCFPVGQNYNFYNDNPRFLQQLHEEKQGEYYPFIVYEN